MRIPLREERENIINYSIRLSELYSNQTNYRDRKIRGQIFTPKQISIYMVKLFSQIKNNHIKILDPCAGTGILAAALCSVLSKKNTAIKEIHFDLFEIDPKLIPFLEAVVFQCKKELEASGIKTEYKIFNSDFILSNAPNLNEDNKHIKISYDLIIMNPPYYKFKKSSYHSKALKNLVFGHPNLYSLFIGLCSSMMNNKGEMVFISPRSFCSGFYYKKIRNYLLKNTKIKNIHLFNSRSVFFDKILQETIIMKVIKSDAKNCDVIISTSNNELFMETNKFVVNEQDIIFRRNESKIIIIPTEKDNLEVVNTIGKFSDSLESLGLLPLVGPVVPFRCRQYLKEDYNISKNPLIWMDNININSFKILWPKKHKKVQYIYDRNIPQNLLIPVKNYILIRRFSSKEQDKRIISSVLLKKDFEEFNKIGIENHVIYITKKEGRLDIVFAFGISGYLRLKLVDIYFRTLNGNTQVNKFDLVNMPFPNKKIILEIGNYLLKNKISKIDKSIEIEISRIMGISKDLIEKCYC